MLFNTINESFKYNQLLNCKFVSLNLTLKSYKPNVAFFGGVNIIHQLELCNCAFKNKSYSNYLRLDFYIRNEVLDLSLNLQNLSLP